jgi:hypothetical protein
MKKLSFFYAEYMDGTVKRFSNLVLPLVMLHQNLVCIRSQSGDVVWNCSVKKPTN